ncbi:MAG: SpoIID/LytB domain-containing protein [Firmicutes bacterium]|nr:SpoIID/LytB domain-containing protein [Bacillota bacterium]
MSGFKSASFVRFMSLVLLVATVSFLWLRMPVGAAEPRGNDRVRVEIATHLPEVKLVFQGRYQLVDTLSGDVIAATDPSETWTVANENGLLRLQRNGENEGLDHGSIKAAGEVESGQTILSGANTLQQKNSLAGLAVLSAGTGLSHIGAGGDLRVLDGKGGITSVSRGARGGLNLFSLDEYGAVSHYRGSVELIADGAGVKVINELPVEQYLYGVVPAEMPVSFPPEALKAQAVASRTYVQTQLGSHAIQGFDVTDNQQNQVYRGYDSEQPQASQAVDETAGEVLTYQGQPISAYFHASSGGDTENSEDVWNEPLEYIRAREDPADLNSKYYNWTVTYSAAQLTQVINEKLQGLSNAVPYSVFAQVTDLQEVQRTASGQRVKRLLIEGLDAAGNPVQAEIYNADRVRMALGLNSSLFSMQKEVDANGLLSSVVISGSGLGHGLGMSQWGASGLAAQGYNYREILQYYYTGVELVSNYGV